MWNLNVTYLLTYTCLPLISGVFDIILAFPDETIMCLVGR